MKQKKISISQELETLLTKNTNKLAGLSFEILENKQNAKSEIKRTIWKYKNVLQSDLNSFLKEIILKSIDMHIWNNVNYNSSIINKRESFERAMKLINEMNNDDLYHYYNSLLDEEYFLDNINQIITDMEYEKGWVDGSKNPEVAEIFWQQFYNFKMFGIDEYIEMSNNDLENGKWENEKLTHLETLKLIGLEGYDDDSIIYDFVIDNAEEI